MYISYVSEIEKIYSFEFCIAGQFYPPFVIVEIMLIKLYIFLKSQDRLLLT